MTCAKVALVTKMYSLLSGLYKSSTGDKYILYDLCKSSTGDKVIIAGSPVGPVGPGIVAAHQHEATYLRGQASLSSSR